MAETEPALTVRLELLDRTLSRFKSFSLDSSYMTSTDGWEVELYDENRKNLFGLECHPVEISLGGQQQCLGRVDVSEVGAGEGSSVTLRGRDYIADMVECNVDPSLKLKDAMTLSDAILLACGPVGITKVLGDDESVIRSVRTGKSGKSGNGKKHKLKKLSDYKPTPGQGLYEFVNKLAARQGATIQPAERRDTVLLSSPDYAQKPLYEIRRAVDRVKATHNNVITASAVRDFSRFPTVALFTGAGGSGTTTVSTNTKQVEYATLALNYASELLAILDRIWPAQGPNARRKPGKSAPLGDGFLYRLLNFKDQDAKNQEQLDRGAERAIAERLKDTLAYRVKLKGHTDPDTGALWAVNTMVNVVDERCGISEPLWIESRKFSASPSGGAITELECWRPESFKIGE